MRVRSSLFFSRQAGAAGLPRLHWPPQALLCASLSVPSRTDALSHPPFRTLSSRAAPFSSQNSLPIRTSMLLLPSILGSPSAAHSVASLSLFKTVRPAPHSTVSPLLLLNPLGSVPYPSVASSAVVCSGPISARHMSSAAAGSPLPGALSEGSIQVASDGKLRLGTAHVPGQARQTVVLIKDGRVWSLSSCVDDVAKAELGDVGWNDLAEVIGVWGTAGKRLDMKAAKSHPLEDVRFCAPFPSPRGPIMCIGKNYAEHVKEVDTWKTAPNITEPSIPKHPIVFTKAPQSVIGPGDGIRLPPPHISSKVDYEAELAVIIGKGGCGIPREKAMDHVFGYTILNDVTARDVQKLHQQWFLGKSCDTFCPMGPWVVPASQLDGTDLGIKCWVNDELRQNGRSSQLIFPIEVLISTISKAMTLRPGDIIATGTPSGVGSGFNPPKHLKSGDVVRIQIEGIGELVNPVVSE